MPELLVARSELILGGQGSGKTARAQDLAVAWLALSPVHEAVYIATAQPWDAELRARIERHRRERAQRVPRMRTVEEPQALARAIGQHSHPSTLVVVDCLTLWLTALMMAAVPLPGQSAAPSLAGAVAACAGPLVLISNEIEPELVPSGRDGRVFLGALGTVNQEAAAACERVTLMSAGLPMTLKGLA